MFGVEMLPRPCEVSLPVKHRFRSGAVNTKQPRSLVPSTPLLIEAPAVYGNWGQSRHAVHLLGAWRDLIREKPKHRDQQRKA